MVAQWMLIFTIGDPSGHRWLPAAACTRARAAEAHPCIVMSWLPKIRRVRRSRFAPSSADAAIARACHERDRWIVNSASLWTASGPQSGRLRPAGSPYVEGLFASVARRLCAVCVPPLPSFLTRTPERVRRRVMGQHKATTSNTRAGSTVVGQAHCIRSKTGQSRARSRRHDDPGETDGQDREDRGSEAG
jgi:hypothetical protein